MMYTHMYTLAQALILQVVVSEDAIVIAEVHSRFHIEGECPGIPPLQNSQRLIPPSPLLPFHLLLIILFLLLLSHHPSFLPSLTTFQAFRSRTHLLSQVGGSLRIYLTHYCRELGSSSSYDGNAKGLWFIVSPFSTFQ